MDAYINFQDLNNTYIYKVLKLSIQLASLVYLVLLSDTPEKSATNSLSSHSFPYSNHSVLGDSIPSHFHFATFWVMLLAQGSMVYKYMYKLHEYMK